MSDLFIIFAEVSLVIIIFLFLILLLGNSSKLLTKFSIFKSDDQRLKSLRRNMTRLLSLVCLVLCILIVGANGFWLYQGKNLQEYTLELIGRIPSGFWLTLGIGIAQSIGTVIVAAIGLKLLKNCLKVASTSAKKI